MIDTLASSPYQRLFVDPVARHIAPFISPICVTLLALAFGLASLPLLLFATPPMAVAALLISGYLDTLDGTIARHQDKTSPMGAALDIFGDRCVEFTVILALFLQAPADRGLVCLLMLGSILLCITSFLVVAIFTENQTSKSFNYTPGLIERTEAFALFIAMMLLPSHILLLGTLFTLLVTLTAIIRLIQFASRPV